MIENKAKLAWKSSPKGFQIMPDIVEKLLPGFYDLQYDPNYNTILFVAKDTIQELYYNLHDKSVQFLIEDYTNFIQAESIYKKYGLSYKRGYLLYGEPGTGKTVIFTQLTEQLKALGAYIFNINGATVCDKLCDQLGNLRVLCGDSLIALLFEDIESIFTSEASGMSKLLNMMDGQMQVDKIMYFATTNYPEKIEDRLKKRPGRFDVRIKCHKLSKGGVITYLKGKGLDDKEIKIWLSNIKEEITVAELKELICATKIFGEDLSTAINRIDSLSENIVCKEIKKVGFESISA